MRGPGWRRALALGALAMAGAVGANGFAACSSEGPGEPAGRDEDAASATPAVVLDPSPGAEARVADLRARFLRPAAPRTPAATGSAHALPPAEIASVIGDGSVERFELRGDRVRAVVDPVLARDVLKRATVDLPNSAAGGVVVRDHDSGVQIEFWPERVASDAPIEVGSGLALYARASADGGDVVHRVTAEGTEDFIVFERAPVRPEVAYRVDVSAVAGLRLVENVLEFLDAGGAPRLRVMRPYLSLADGSRVEARLSLHGCAADTSPEGPWDRPVTPPGARICEVRVGWAAGHARYPALLDPAWTTTGNLVGPRVGHAAALLASGNVVVAGGNDGSDWLSTAEVYATASGTWSVTGSLATKRERAKAVRLGNGRVLVMGGRQTSDLSTAELYDPGPGTWSATGSMSGGPWWGFNTHAYLLSTGRVLVFGFPSSSPILYDPALGTWSDTGDMSTDRHFAASSMLASGRVMITGGNPSYVSTAETYDPTLGTWSSAASMGTARNYQVQALLGTGRVLVAGGQNSFMTLSTAELYNESTNTWAATNAMPSPSQSGVASLHGSGKLLVSWGRVYGPTAGTWLPSGSPPFGPETLTTLANGRILAVGCGTTCPTTALFDLVATGSACSQPGECVSEFCVDGFCCNTACTALCQACSNAKTGAASGTCTNIPNRTDPDTECSAGANTTCNGAGLCGSGCDADGDCNGTYYCTSATTGTCTPDQAQGTACAGDTVDPTGNHSCSSTFCVDGFCCNGVCNQICRACAASKTGTINGNCDFIPNATDPDNECSSGVSTTCNGASNCGSGCDADSDCNASYYCSSATAGSCTADKANGQACAGDSIDATGGHQCTSGNCVDGVCCNTTCTGLCRGCTSAHTGGANGTCGSVASASDPDNECSVAPNTTCDGSGACGPACNADADCDAGYYCTGTVGGTCVLDKAQGAVCASDGIDPTGNHQCASGACRDGFCCESGCAGLCLACSNAKTGQASGLCRPVTAGTDLDGECPSDPVSGCQRDGTCNGASPTPVCRLYSAATQCVAQSCASSTVENDARFCDGSGTCESLTQTTCNTGYTCTSSACNTTCTNDTHCTGPYYCNTATSACVPDDGQGVACTTGGHCQSGNCVDGFCCDAPCSGACEACSAALKGFGSNGVCEPVSAGTDPDNQCAQDPGYPDSCQADGTCNGAGLCRIYAVGGTGCGTPQCSAPGTLSQFQCNGAGNCLPVSTSCEPYVCASGTACRTSCSVNAHCASGYYCSGGACVPKKALGETCGAAAECQSAFCVDGVCCDSNCAGTCRACSALAKGYGTDGVCDNASTGTDPHSDCPTQPQPGCAFDGQCNGSGACRNWQAGTQCGATSCVGNSVRGQICDGGGTCITDPVGTDCAPFICSGTACTNPCATDASCLSGYYCASGACLAKRVTGEVCSAANQCQSAFCVDGVCCDSACTGTCKACSNAAKGYGADGACDNVNVGLDPHGNCPATAQSTCGFDGACNGAGACERWPTGTTCGTGVCTGSVLNPRVCDGLGTCVTQASGSDCAPYACATGACTDPCTSNAQCTSANYCSGGACVPKLPTGSACGASAECSSGFCVDGVCCDSTCTGTCRACSALAKGYGNDGVCDFVRSGDDPDDDCLQEPTSGCGLDGTCNGSGACRRWPNGTQCGPTSCVGNSVTGRICDGIGTCIDSPGGVSCTPYVCSGSACTIPCTADVDCVAGYYCGAAGSCTQKKVNGDACSGGGQCQSGNCADGVCCDSVCAATCKACSAAAKGFGQDGVCDNVRVATDPRNDCPLDAPSSCLLDGTCDGAGACRRHVTGTTCAADVCVGNSLNPRQCDGLGTCITAVTGTSCVPYVCQTGVCQSPCVTNTDCSAGNFCDAAGTCVPKLGNGASCTSTAECQSGFCVDGVCCDSACAATCRACSTAAKGYGADGVCDNVGAGGDPHSDCPADMVNPCGFDGQCGVGGACRLAVPGVQCGASSCVGNTVTGQICDGLGTCINNTTGFDCTPHRCLASACALPCASDFDCVSGYYCSALGVCEAKLSIGALCATPSACQSTYCADGVCCDSACGGTCRGCSAAAKGFGADGSCDYIADGDDPDDDCPDDGPTSCDFDGACNGSGACRRYASGVACGPGVCSGNEVRAESCNGLGSCVTASAGTSCAPYACVGGACLGGCTTDADCGSSAFCDTTGVCVQKQANGATCAAGSECQSTFCADGVCCESQCAATCRGCSTATKGYGANGVCDFVIVATDPRSDCPEDAANACGLDGQCNGNGVCRLRPSGTACGVTSCQGNTVTGEICDGMGSCLTSAQGVDCEPYLCRNDQCTSPCAAETDCASGFYCNTVNGACEEESSNGQSCTTASTCRSGYCVDGVCCDSSCRGQCEACDVVGSEGTCAPVEGTPHGSRALCNNAGAECGGECDGVNPGACGYPASGTACGTPTCESGSARTHECNGQGECTPQAPVSCAAYACDATACKSTCSAEADCASGFECDAASTCVSKRDNECSEDRSQSIDRDGNATECEAYLCNTEDGTCAIVCASTDDCARGYACDVTTRTCIEASNDLVGDEGGCGCRSPGSRPTHGLAALTAALVLGIRRRRSAPGARRAA